MEIRKEFKILFWIALIFGVAFFLPIESAMFNTAIAATLDLVKWYAREHTVLCLLPTFVIAGVISVFVSQGSVLKYFGTNAKKWLAYTVAAVSGTVLAVCSCTILPLLAIGVVTAGFLLGSTQDGQTIAGIIPNEWINTLVGGNSFFYNLFASVVGTFMYFATLTEVPILQGLIAAGMGKGPALALLLAGPSLSLPNMLVIRGVMGTQKTVVYVVLVIIMTTISGLIYGAI